MSAIHITQILIRVCVLVLLITHLYAPRIVLCSNNRCLVHFNKSSRVAQWKRAGPITQRSVDRNHALLEIVLHSRIAILKMHSEIIGK